MKNLPRNQRLLPIKASITSLAGFDEKDIFSKAKKLLYSEFGGH